MTGYKVAITDYGFPDLNEEKTLLEPIGFSVVSSQCKTEDEVKELCHHADAILTQWAPVTKRVIDQLIRCKIIVRYGIGVDNVDLAAAKAKGIPVVNVPDYAIDEVADHAMALLLGSIRKIVRINRQVHDGVWEIAPFRPIEGLSGKKLGLAGFGNIARAVAKRAKAFGVEVLVYDPFVQKEVLNQFGVEGVEWNTLLAASDFISIHLPLNKDTKHLFNRFAFERMKRSAYLINTSRGAVVNSLDLASALKDGTIAGAALDVLEEEPIPSNHPLLSHEQCLLTSHCAWYSETSLVKLQRYAALEIRRMFTGEKPKHIVNGVIL